MRAYLKSSLFHNTFSFFLLLSVLLHGILWLALRLSSSGISRVPIIEVKISQAISQKTISEKKSNRSQSAAMAATPTNAVPSDAFSSLNQTLQNRIRYPVRAAAMGWQGLVSVRVIVDSQGGIAQLIFTHKDPHDDFNRAVSDALRDWQFDYPEGSDIPLTFRFILADK